MDVERSVPPGTVAVRDVHDARVLATTPSTPTGPEEGAALQPKVWLAALRRRWFPCLVLGLLVAAAVAVPLWYLTPAPFTASSEVHIQSRLDLILPGSGDPREKFRVYKQNQIKYLKSDFTLTAARREIDDLATIREQDEPEDWLRSNLRIGSVGEEFVRVQLSGERPEELARIVNAVTAAYVREVEKREGGRRLQRIADLERVRADLLDKKKQASIALRDLAQRAGAATVTESENRQEALLAAALAVRQQFSSLYVDLLRKRIELEARRTPEGEVDEAPLPDELVEAYLVQTPRYAETTESIRTARAYLVALERTVSAESPKLTEARRRIADLERSRDENRDEMLPTVREDLRRQIEKRSTQSTAQLEREVELLGAQVEGFQKEMREFEVDAEDNQSFTFELRELTLKLEEIESFYGKVNSELQRLDIERESSFGISVFSDATPPRSRNKGRKAKFAAMGGLGGFGLVVLGLLFLDVRKTRVSSVDDLHTMLGMPILGSLPIIPRSASTNGRPSTKSAYWYDVLTESVDATRAIIVQQSRSQGVKTVMVASATSGEGKTTVSCHVASSLARTGRRVLLVDCDLRRPSVGEVFDVDESRGFSEMLQGTHTLEELVQPSGQANLSVLPAGSASRESIDALSIEETIVPVLDELREAYDVVVFDSAPLLAVTDGLVLAHRVDCVLLTARRDVTQRTKIAAAYDRLRMVGASVLGVVVIGLRSDTDRNSAYYGGYAGTYGRPPASSDVASPDVASPEDSDEALAERFAGRSR